MANCQACVLTCMDFRIQAAVADWLRQKGLTGNYDYLSLPGASRNFLSEGKIKLVELSYQLHQIKEVYLFHHEDCGAYDLGDMPVEEQLARQRQDMDAAARMIKERHPELEVHMAFLYLNGNVINLTAL
ncbi:carbonic anhydrase [Moorella sulfitireducens]|uniref:carbonic anhydrase n=1 Tax=Neomoorella sulfitireducens TaxID=2972948 RepID=UPI0021AC5F1E|nr:carbonic anhydrase [Moorella sulfitireducens]